MILSGVLSQRLGGGGGGGLRNSTALYLYGNAGVVYALDADGNTSNPRVFQAYGESFTLAVSTDGKRVVCRTGGEYIRAYAVGQDGDMTQLFASESKRVSYQGVLNAAGTVLYERLADAPYLSATAISAGGMADLPIDSLPTATIPAQAGCILSPDGKWLITPYNENTLSVYAVTAGGLTLHGMHPVGSSYLGSMAFSPDGNRFCLCQPYWPTRVGIWGFDSASGTITGMIAADDNSAPLDVSANGCAWSPDGTRLAVCFSNAADFRIYDVSGDSLSTFIVPGVHASSVAWSNDGRFVVGTYFDTWNTSVGFRVYSATGVLISSGPAPAPATNGFNVAAFG
jgi:WD40 repeat protein